MRRLFVGLLLLICVEANAQTHWSHNGSVVTLYANGALRQFTYASPRAGLPVGAGTLLFKGTKSGNSYSGIAYIFSSRCGALPYNVSGPVSDDQRSVTMIGKAPRVNDACKVIDYVDDVLVFNFIDPVGNNVTRIAADLEGEQPTLICLRPVFTEEFRLRQLIDGDRARTAWVAQAINYLRAKYCGQVIGTPKADQSTQIQETCIQNSGVYQGERVYWGGCYE